MVNENPKSEIRNPKIRKSICLFCAMGCGVAFRTAGEHVTAIDYDKENPINRGSLCPRGNYNFELLNHPARLAEPRIGQKKISWSEAISFLGRKLKESPPDSVGIFISALASNEDAYMAAKLAQALGTKNISAAGNRADQEAYQGSRGEVEGANLAKIEEIEKDEALLIIGDILAQAPCLSKNVNKVKYGKRGNQVIVIDPNQTHTAWFATTHLKNKPGTEALLLAAMAKVLSDKHKKGKLDIDLEKAAKTVGISQEAIVKAAQDFDAAPSGTIIFVPRKENENNELVGYLIKVLAGLSAGKKFITFYGFGNTLGVNMILDRVVEGHTSYAELLKKIENGQIKSLLMLGEDVAASHPELEKKIRGLEFVGMSNYFVTPLLDEALMLFPLASHLESAASYVSADGRVQKAEPVAPKVGTKSNFEIVAGLLGGAADAERTSQEAKQMVEKGIPPEKVDLKQKSAEAQKIKARDHLPELNITHFGNNCLAKRFFWYRVNNKIG